MKNDDLSQKLAHGSSAVQLPILDSPYCTVHFISRILLILLNLKKWWLSNEKDRWLISQKTAHGSLAEHSSIFFIVFKRKNPCAFLC